MKNSARFSAIFSDQHGQIAAIFLAIFAFLLVFFMIPRKFTRSTAGIGGGGCTVGTAPAQNTLVRMPKIADMNMDRGLGENGPIMDELVDYVLIRKDVLVGDSVFFLAEEDSPPNEHSFRLNLPALPDRVLYFPARFGHVKFHRAFTSQLDNGPNKDIMLYRTEGLVVAVHKNTDGTELTKEIGDPARPQPVRVADYYQMKEVFDRQKGYQTEELFYCTTEEGVAESSSSGIMIPPQQVSSDNQQLQLEWFIFGVQKVSEGFVYPHCKPAVYLYPPQKMQINVKVFPSGTLSYTDPIYDSKQGWNVIAYPDGKIYDSRISKYPNPFNYLYFESKIRDEVIQKPTQGWVVKYDQLTKLYEDILPKLGLNEQQKTDFIQYWQKTLPESPYYFVGVIDPKNVDQIEKLEITPKPDSINRVRIYFERLDQPKVVEAPELSAFSRQLSAGIAEGGWQKADDKFKVVEWGGMVKTDLDHPFTCSQ